VGYPRTSHLSMMHGSTCLQIMRGTYVICRNVSRMRIERTYMHRATRTDPGLVPSEIAIRYAGGGRLQGPDCGAAESYPNRVCKHVVNPATRRAVPGAGTGVPCNQDPAFSLRLAYAHYASSGKLRSLNRCYALL
jgi:hypothetical protein